MLLSAFQDGFSRALAGTGPASAPWLAALQAQPGFAVYRNTTAKGCIDAARDTVTFDKLNEYDEALAYLPLAWVGDHYLNYAQGLVAGIA